MHKTKSLLLALTFGACTVLASAQPLPMPIQGKAAVQDGIQVRPMPRYRCWRPPKKWISRRRSNIRN